jgi:ribosomal protein L35
MTILIIKVTTNTTMTIHRTTSHRNIKKQTPSTRNNQTKNFVYICGGLHVDAFEKENL